MNTTKPCSSPLSVVLANRFGRIIAACAFAAMGSSTMAATTWNFSACNGNAANQSGAGTYGNSWSCAGAAGTNKVTASAWGGADDTGSTGFRTAYLSPQGTSGFGVASRYETLGVSSPNHSADNSPTNGTPDLIVLKFDTAVALSTVSLGWTQYDADFTLMAYNGVSPTILGKNASNLNTGWALVENSSGSSTGTRAVNSGDVVSSWWLISAYSSSYGGGTLDGYKDYFKLLAVASRDVTQSGSVPEPGSLALLGAGLMGLMASRRRNPSSRQA